MQSTIHLNVPAELKGRWIRASRASGMRLSDFIVNAVEDYMQNPTPEQVKATRTAAGHSQSQAAETIYKGLRTWQQWEKGERAMDPAFFELYLIKTNQQA